MIENEKVWYVAMNRGTREIVYITEKRDEIIEKLEELGNDYVPETVFKREAKEIKKSLERKAMNKEYLRQLALEYVGDTVGYLRQAGRLECPFNDLELVSYLELDDYDNTEHFGELLEISDGLNIDNSRTRFEDRVVAPIKLAQGIYS